MPALIVGMALIGLGGSAQQSFSFVSNELVPMKYRFIVVSWLYLWCLPTSAFGGAVSKAFVLYTGPGWRWYLQIPLSLFFLTKLANVRQVLLLSDNLQRSIASLISRLLLPSHIR